MRFVAVKTVAQQDIQAAHRIRSELIGHRTAKANQIRGLVAKYGLVAPQQLARLRTAVPNWLEDAENGLTGRFRGLLSGLWDDLKTLDYRVAELDSEIKGIAQSDPVSRRLQQLRGVGPLVATALVAAVGEGSCGTQARQRGCCRTGQQDGPHCLYHAAAWYRLRAGLYGGVRSRAQFI